LTGRRAGRRAEARGDPGADGDTLRGQRLGGQLADARVLPVDEPARPLDDGDLRTHPAVELGELDADRAAADQQHPGGDVADVGGFPAGPHRHLVQALDGRADRLGSGGDHHVLCFQLLPGCLDPAGPGEPGGALDDRGAGLLVVLDLGGVIEVPDHVVVVIAQNRPVEDGGSHPGGPAGLGPRLRAAQQRLGRDARPVGAFAADQLPLDERDPSPRGEQPPGGGTPASARKNVPVHAAARSLPAACRAAT